MVASNILVIISDGDSLVGVTAEGNDHLTLENVTIFIVCPQDNGKIVVVFVLNVACPSRSYRIR